MNKWITVFKFFFWRDTSDIRSETEFYGDAQAEPSNVISQRISDYIPPQMKLLNMVIPILMRFYRLISHWSTASRIKPYKGVRHLTKCDLINDIKLFLTVYRMIYCRKFKALSNQTLHNKKQVH